MKKSNYREKKKEFNPHTRCARHVFCRAHRRQDDRACGVGRRSVRLAVAVFLYFAVYIVIGYDVLFKAGRGIVHGQVLDENLLMCIASLGAFALGIYTSVTGRAQEGFDEGCAVLLFYQVGEFSKATQRANPESRYPRLWTFVPITPT